MACNDLPIGTLHVPSPWDGASAIRERLFLLSRVAAVQPQHWSYNPRRDEWTNGESGQRLRVTMEGSDSLAALQKRGIERQAAMLAIGYPEPDDDDPGAAKCADCDAALPSNQRETESGTVLCKDCAKGDKPCRECGELLDKPTQDAGGEVCFDCATGRPSTSVGE
jgi:hypothetical protein